QWLRARGSSSGGIGDSVGDPFIDWKGREFAVLPPSSVVMKLPGIFVTKLVIEHPEQEHAGEYVCMATTTKGTAVGTANLTVLPRGPGSILLVVMGLLGSIAVIAVVTAVVATYRRRRRQQRHVGAFKPAPTAGDYKGHPSSQASSNLLQADDCQRQPIGKNGMASSVNGGPYPPRYVRPPGVQGRVGDSGALLPHQEGMMAR
ncbi:Immunoglobulin-like domain, partial [Trinorchestia longiramus]